MIQYKSTIDSNFQVLKHDLANEKVMVAGTVKSINLELDNIKVGGFKAISVLHYRELPLSKEDKRAVRYYHRKKDKGQENAVYARVIAQHMRSEK